MREILMPVGSDDAVELTEGLIEEYLAALAARGRNQDTVKTYRRCLRELRSFLLREDLPLTTDAVALWHDSLGESDLSAGSVNTRLSVAKGLLEYCDILPTTLRHDRTQTMQIRPTPTRTEYLRLLSYIRARGTRQEYFLVKIFGQIGLDVSELPNLTVEACRAGEITDENDERTAIPAGLCRELLQYAEERSVVSGPVMVTRNGKPIHRANVNHILNNVSASAGLAPEKFSPSVLGRMCRQAQEDIRKKLEPLYIQSYE
ncbi:MAG: site-specific integrase, partial [Oscillospiraceae bacterium]|nr:site-specific integrase [Oscillospiraceae bacterium]